MTPRNCLTALLLALPAAQAQETSRPQSLRGEVAIEATSPSNVHRVPRDRAPFARDFAELPPLIPHPVKGYAVTKNFNKCMDCHSRARAGDTGATEVSKTHFRDRDGAELANISPRRYFCMQCHVPQTDAEPLVRNGYRSDESLRPQAKRK